MVCDSNVHAEQLPRKAGCSNGVRRFPEIRNTNERMADLEKSEKVPNLALLRLPDLLRRGATMESSFDILKKIDAFNFEWVEAVRDLQTAEARIQERLGLSPGEYVV